MADLQPPQPTQFNEGQKKPLDQTFIQRALQGLRYAFTGRTPDNAWFGPLAPIVPVVPAELQDTVRARRMDFQAGYNLRQQPRSEEQVSFAQLRALADNCDVLRLVIETRKDQMASQTFSVVPIDEDAEPDDRCREVQDFFKLPNGEDDFVAWQRQILEDMFVLDAVAIYPWLRNDGSLYRLDLMDGATIKRVINDAGRTPLPPEAAYQQVLKGVPVTDYTSDELLYFARNKRTHKVYGYSPVEQIIVTVNTAIRRALHQLTYYTRGSTPDLLFSCPPEWNMDQVRDFNDWWQDMLSGNLEARRMGTFIPHGVAPVNTKEGVLTDKYDEWLARIVCYAFSVSPTPFVAQVNRATAESAQEAALMEGLHPVMKWMKGLLDTVIWRYFGYTDLHVKWDENKSIDPAVQAQVNDTKIRNGSKTINEARADDGMDPVEGGDKPLIMLPTGPVELAAAVKVNTQNLLNPPEPAQPPPQPGGGDGAAGGDGGASPAAQPKQQQQQQPAAAGNSATAKASMETGVRKAASKKAVGRIDRNRPAVRMLQRVMRKKVAKHLAAVKTSAVSQVVKAFANTPKPVATAAPTTKAERVRCAMRYGAACACHPGARPLSAMVSLDVAKAGGEKSRAQELAEQILSELNLSDDFADMKGDMADLIGQIMRDAGVEANAQISVDPTDDALELSNEKAMAWAEEHAAELVQGIEEATREMLRSDVEDAMAEGWSNERLADELVENYAFSDARAETIARTETAKADVQGNLQAYGDSGVVDSKQWVVGDGCCDLCDALDGTVVALDDTFDFDGEDVDGPPGHPRCRCDILPVLSDDGGQGEEEEGADATD